MFHSCRACSGPIQGKLVRGVESSGVQQGLSCKARGVSSECCVLIIVDMLAVFTCLHKVALSVGSLSMFAGDNSLQVIWEVEETSSAI